MWYIDYSSGFGSESITEIDDETLSHDTYAYDIFKIGSTFYTILRSNGYLVYDVTSSPFSLEGSDYGGGDVGAYLYGIVDGVWYNSFYYSSGVGCVGIRFNSSNGSTEASISYGFDTPNSVDSFAGTKGITYDDVNDKYYLTFHDDGERGADIDTYLGWIRFSSPYNGVVTKTDLHMMTSRNNYESYLNPTEKAFMIDGTEIYELRPDRDKWVLLQNISNSSDFTDGSKIISLSDHFIFVEQSGGTVEVWKYTNQYSIIEKALASYKLGSPTTLNIMIDEVLDYNQIVKIFDDNENLTIQGIVTEKTYSTGSTEYTIINFDREITNQKVTAEYSSKTVPYIIEDLIDTYSSYLYYDSSVDDAGNMTDTYDISFSEIPLSDAFNTLLDLEDGIWFVEPGGKTYAYTVTDIPEDMGTFFYHGTYSFKREIGETGTDIEFIDSATLYNGEAEVISKWQKHKNVLRLQDDATAGEDPIIIHNEVQATAGTREFYVGTNDVSETFWFYFQESGAGNVYFRIHSSQLQYNDGSFQNIQTVTNEILYHIKFTWRVDNTYDLYVNNVKQLDNISMTFSQSSGIERFILYATGDSEDYFYLDAYGDVDNDPNYSEGDNLCINEHSNIQAIPKVNVVNQQINKVHLYGGYDSSTGKRLQTGDGYGEDEKGQLLYGIIEYVDHFPHIHDQSTLNTLSDDILNRQGIQTNPIYVTFPIKGMGYVQVGKTINFKFDKPNFDEISSAADYYIHEIQYDIKRDINTFKISNGLIQKGREYGDPTQTKTSVADEEQIDNVANDLNDHILASNPHTITLEKARTAGNTVSGDIDMDDNTILNNASYILLQDKKTSGTDGGTFSSGSWLARTFTTEVVDEPNVCSVGGSNFTLEAGTYIIKASAPAYKVNRHQIRLYNNTDASVVCYGTSEYVSGSYYVNNRSFLSYKFTIAAQKQFEIEHRCQTTMASTGRGIASNFGGDEIYSIVELWKVG